MILNKESVDAYKELITRPKENGLDFPALDELLEQHEEGTPKHILFQQYIDIIKKPVPKVMFYIIVDELYPAMVKCADGNFGWKLKIKNI